MFVYVVRRSEFIAYSVNARGKAGDALKTLGFINDIVFEILHSGIKGFNKLTMTGLSEAGLPTSFHAVCVGSLAIIPCWAVLASVLC